MVPLYHVNDYETQKAIIQLQSKAIDLFHSYKNHHFYKNETFQRLFLDTIFEIVMCIEHAIKFLNHVSASCIVVPSTAYSFSRILVLAAAEKGIPSICMQHGIIANEFGHLPKMATINAVYGEFEVDWYQQCGVQKEFLEIIGHPRFDQAFQPPYVIKS
ncbi:hypothetical protein [Alkalihalobacillus sp. BA299]|uniref:hypothetical protein n=1 Tax=Alkalihalobacillus sp. BA299 TaxID=2815938 RepID=UPI001ADC91B7|nr:hypothetical protein [Alkalihalobacillus sp. BA299]